MSQNDVVDDDDDDDDVNYVNGVTKWRIKKSFNFGKSHEQPVLKKKLVLSLVRGCGGWLGSAFKPGLNKSFK